MALHVRLLPALIHSASLLPLPTTQVALSLCGPNPTHLWLTDAAPAAPCCTPLHMAAVLPDGGKLATAILARNPEVQPLWLGLPLEQPPPSPLRSKQQEQVPVQYQQQQQPQQQQAHGGALTASSTLTSPSTWGLDVSGTSSSISPGAVSTPGVSILSSHSLSTNKDRDSAGSAAPSPAVAPIESTKAIAGVAGASTTGSHAGAARVLLDPRPGSPAALAAACGNWVRTAWAQSSTVGGAGGGVTAASTGGAVPPHSILQQQQQLTTLPVSARVPGAQHALASSAPALRSPTAVPAEVGTDSELLSPSVPILQAPPVSRGGSKHPSLPNTPTAAARPDDASPQPDAPVPARVPSGALQAFMDAQPAVCTLTSLVYGVVMWVIMALAQLAAAWTVQSASWLGVDARRLWTWAKLLCMGFGEQEDAVVLGRGENSGGGVGGPREGEEGGGAGARGEVESSCLLAYGKRGEQGQRSQLEARYMHKFRGILLGQLGVEGSFAWGALLQVRWCCVSAH
eukprot:1153391-Pelagomonas_calceolata.AAC.15